VVAIQIPPAVIVGAFPCRREDGAKGWHAAQGTAALNKQSERIMAVTRSLCSRYGEP
jgi:hypothetical protein